ncbi:MAG: histidine phosphatase family protein [Rhodocyclaceae bacterium]|nr:histidine phosphatase family protein [Rhodocyclaceae bacterium]
MNAPVFRPPSEEVSPTRLCIVRHGETDWNAQRRIQGQIDIPLNATGRQQAEATAKGLLGLPFAAIYSSDLQRAHDTAAAAAALLQLPVRPEPGLRERHYGEFQGLTQDEIKARADYERYINRDTGFAFGNGESLAGFAERIKRTVNDLAQRHAGESLLIFAHGGVLDVIYRIATHRPLETARDFPIPNAALNWVEVGNPDWQLIEWGVQDHLAGSRELVLE